MNLKQLKYVLVLSQEGSFSKAADVLNISQPSLSQYIKKIEKQLGAALFVRVNGNVRLTDAGQVYLEAGKKILALEHQMENQLTDIASFKSGTVTLGISPYRSVRMLPLLLAEFDKRYPNMTLRVQEYYGDALLEAALHGECDVCVMALPIDETVFDYEVIQQEEIVIAVNRHTKLYEILQADAKESDHRAYPEVDIHLTEGHDFAVLNEYRLMRAVTDRILQTYGVQIHPKIELSSNASLISVVESGVCASFVPSGMAGSPTDTVAFFSIRQHFEYRNIAAIWRKDQYLAKPARDLVRILKDIHEG